MNKKIDLTIGNIKTVLLLFMVPIFFANLFQQLYNTVDTMIVGHYLGDNALAAMGATASLFELLVGFATGVGSGFSVVIARCVGSKNIENTKKAIAGTILLSLVLTVIIMILSVTVLIPFMHFLNTPQNIFDDAYSYIYTICIAVGITVLYNMLSGMLRAKGNAFIPLIALLISSCLNIFLDIYCIVNLKMGTRGAAVATVISQAVSSIFCLIYIYTKEKDLIPDKTSFSFDKYLYSDLIGQGLSMGMMLSIVSMGTVILQTAINKCGTEVIAGYTSARKVLNFETMPISTLATALTTYVSQNYGANNKQRIIDGVRFANILGLIWCAIIIAIVFPFSNFFIHLISSTNSREVLYYGSTYIKVSTIFTPFLAPLLNLRCSLQGLGQKIVPLFSSIIELVGKFILVSLLIPATGFMGICFTEPLVWVAMLLQLIWSYKHTFLFEK